MKNLKLLIRFVLTYPVFFTYLILGYLNDWLRFFKYSSVKASIFFGRSNKMLRNKEQLRSLIVADYHKIEKGLALKNRRPGFGIVVVQRLLDNIEEYCQSFAYDQPVEIAFSCLVEYQTFNNINHSSNESINKRIDHLKNKLSTNEDKGNGGTVILTKANILENGKKDLEHFFNSRYSIRDFSNEKIDQKDFKQAISMAQKTPSVCNRQSIRAYLYKEKREVLKVLSCQNGSASFADKVTSVFIITSNLETFFTPDERNQCWIDGGLFSMSLVYSLHSLGIGSCCLNWCSSKKDDQKLYAITGIPKSEVEIMLIACGKYPEELRVAKSTRRSIDEVLVEQPLNE